MYVHEGPYIIITCVFVMDVISPEQPLVWCAHPVPALASKVVVILRSQKLDKLLYIYTSLHLPSVSFGE